MRVFLPGGLRVAADTDDSRAGSGLSARRSPAIAAFLVLSILGLVPSAGHAGQPPQAAPSRPDPVETLARLAPGLKRTAIREALSAVDCARSKGLGTDATRLAIIDYTKSSCDKRLWVFDLAQPRLLFVEHVAHGKRSGDDVPTEFSNRNGSYKSSLGLFLTDETYDGGNGYSLVLHGLSGPLNAAALERRIVMHGAPYVDPDPEVTDKLGGRLGRSLGCPAVRDEIAQPMIDTIKEGQFLYAYGPGSAIAAKKCEIGPLASYTGRDSLPAPTSR